MDKTDLNNLAEGIQRTDWRTDREKLEGLTDAWKMAKRMEQDWNQQRIAIESEIYELVQSQLSDKGTFTTDTGMKIATGFTEEWDQTVLTLASQKWPGTVPFPFTGLWKPDGKQVTYVRENLPDLYEHIRPALTLKPRKPSFSVKDAA